MGPNPVGSAKPSPDVQTEGLVVFAVTGAHELDFSPDVTSLVNVFHILLSVRALAAQ